MRKHQERAGPEPSESELKLAQALRANLRRRKARSTPKTHDEAAAERADKD